MFTLHQNNDVLQYMSVKFMEKEILTLCRKKYFLLRRKCTLSFIFTDTCSILFDEEELKSYQQQGKSASDLEIYSTKVIKDELLAVGYLDGAIRLWDLKLGQ